MTCCIQKIDVTNFARYYKGLGDNGPAKIGHVNAVIKALNEVAANSGSGGTYLFAGNSSTTTNIDWAQGNVQELNLDNNPTLTFTNGVLGQTSTLLLKRTQAGQRSINWPASVIWSQNTAPTLPTLSLVSVDPSFLVSPGLNSPSYKVLLQSDGKILVGGVFNSYNNTPSQYFVRINTNGTFDNTFNTGASFNNGVEDIAIQPDGKIIAVGYFTSYNGNSVNRIVRLNTNGSIDNTFNIGSGFNNDVLTVAIQPDGKILLGGNFSTYNGNTANAFARLNSDGTFDNTFTMGTGFLGSVTDIEIQSTGKIIVAGIFPSYNGNTCNRIARLNTNGTFDNAFSIGTGFNNTTVCLHIQSDDKILVGGDFTNYNGFSSSQIIRLNSDGTVDTGFNVGTGFNSSVYDIKTQSDGKVVAVGQFNGYNGTSINYICRINTDGSLDTSFQGTSTTGLIISVAIQSDGKIVVGGAFGGFTPNINSVCIGRLVVVSAISSYTKVTFDYNGTYYIGSF